jgi:hypothetical protein
MFTRMDVLADNLVFGMTPAQFALLVSGAAIIFVISRWRKNAMQRNRGPQTSETARFRPSPPASALNMREINTEVEALLAELEETSRRITSQLDNRFQRLELLLAEADEKIRKLEALSGHARSTSPSPMTATPSISAASTQVVLSEAQRTLARLRQERGAPAASEDPAYLPIYSLADRGKSSREIAQELGRQPGEIDLILALRRN